MFFSPKRKLVAAVRYTLLASKLQKSYMISKLWKRFQLTFTRLKFNKASMLPATRTSQQVNNIKTNCYFYISLYIQVITSAVFTVK